MKVFELIELLKKHPLDTEVSFFSRSWEADPDDDVLIEKEYDIDYVVFNKERLKLHLGGYDMRTF